MSNREWKLPTKRYRYESISIMWTLDKIWNRFSSFWYYGQDAAGLTQLSSTVEDVFASGDLPRAAETLASMRNCLSAVGEVMLISTLLV